MSRGGVMVTCRVLTPAPAVRIRPPHPFSIFLLVCLFCSISCIAIGETDGIPRTEGYSISDDVTLLDLLSSGDSVSRSVVITSPYKIFQQTFTFDFDTRRVTKWNSFTITDTAMQHLAFECLDMAVGISNEIDGLSSQIVADLDSWTNTLRDAPDLSTGLSLTHIRVPDLLATLARNQKVMYNASTSFYETSKSTITGKILDYNRYWGYDLAKDTSYSDLLAYVTRNQDVTFAFLRQTLGLFNAPLYNLDGSYGTHVNLGGVFTNLSTNFRNATWWQRSWLTVEGNTDILSFNGEILSTSNAPIADIVRQGFLGYANIISGLGAEGTEGHPGIDVFWTSPDDPLLVSDKPTTYESLFAFLGAFGQNLDRSLTKLQFVLANDEDIEMKQEEKPNEEAVKDNFFGDGEASVGVSDIKDAASLTSGAKDAFSGAGSVADAFATVGDQGNYWFFSQEVADDLDAVGGSPVGQSDDEDWLEDYVFDEDGYGHLKNPSYFDVESYLKGVR